MIDACLKLPVLLFGLLLIRAGREPIRKGDTPHCAACDYNLTGLTSDCCPECGTRLTQDNIARGNLVPRWAMLTSGIVASVISLLFLSRDIYNSLLYDAFWFRACPVSTLMGLSQSINQQTSSKAWNELQRRLESGSLDAAQTNSVIEAALKAMPKPTLAPAGTGVGYIGGFDSIHRLLSNAVSRGHTPAAQKDKFFRHWILGDLKAPLRVQQGDAAPYDIRCVAATMTWDLAFYGFVETAAIYLDDQFITRVADPRGTREHLCSSGMVQCDTPGQHTIRAVFHVVFYEREKNNSGPGSSFFEMDVTFSQTLEVLPLSTQPRPVQEDG